MSDAGSLGAVLLAAGGSKRMGRPKQLLPYRGRTLVWHAARTIVEAGFQQLTVVVGNDSAAISAALADLPVSVCRNNEWERGIGSSIRRGVACAADVCPQIAGVLIALADQPGITVAHFRSLRANFSPNTISASRYDGSLAVPAIFSAEYFRQLQTLADGAGAKSVLMRNAGHVRPVELQQFEDIDLPGDYQRLTAGD